MATPFFIDDGLGFVDETSSFDWCSVVLSFSLLVSIIDPLLVGFPFSFSSRFLSVDDTSSFSSCFVVKSLSWILSRIDAWLVVSDLSLVLAWGSLSGVAERSSLG